jgi:hypothetical protein
MTRFLVFTLLYPPLALAVFTAPDGFKNVLDWLVYAYPAAIIPGWLTMALDWKLRTVGTTLAGGAITGSIALFLGDAAGEFLLVLMAMLVGAVPAAVCSWLSSEKHIAGRMREQTGNQIR